MAARLPPTTPPPAAACLQATEQRYRLLESKHTALATEKDKLFQENETLRQVRMCKLAVLTAVSV